VNAEANNWKAIPADIDRIATDLVQKRYSPEEDTEWLHYLDIANALQAERNRHRLRYARVDGMTIEEMRKRLPSDLSNIGDTILVWVNEGDLYLVPGERFPKAAA